mmetsp:Transcript_38403/g.61923  ORF Transcript_38403/g.61923 Transcript_38403/m.61923 type:complete len:677 (-) Transcript_38403:51-2081(-)
MEAAVAQLPPQLAFAQAAWERGSPRLRAVPQAQRPVTDGVLTEELQSSVWSPGAPFSSLFASPSLAVALAAVAAALGGARAAKRTGRRRGASSIRGSLTACRAVAQADSKVAFKARPLQIIKIDLETNRVLIGEEDIAILEQELKRTGVQKVAVIGVMGAFRTGKSFLLDLMLRYLREKQSQSSSAGSAKEEGEVPEWVWEKDVPEWAVKGGTSLLEGKKGGEDESEGFVWRPGMDKCTEGVWVWSEAFICKAGDEDVAVLLMDTQGAWDAKMSKEQSATVFGLTTLMASRLVYNVSKQIQQDKIDNLLYFTDFAQAALRSRDRSLQTKPPAVKEQPFQTLEFLVRDWPHFPDDISLPEARNMMSTHLDQYFDPQQSEDTKSIDSLKGLFQNIDCWCLPHPSLKVERDSWDGNLSVVEAEFWPYMDAYMERIFSPSELRAKTNLGIPITVDSFGTVLREYIAAFGNAAPQAQSFSEAMEASTSLLARETALKQLKANLVEQISSKDVAVAAEEFERLASEAARQADEAFSSKAIFGTEDGIQRRKALLTQEVLDEIERFREDNERKLEASLNGLASLSLAAIAAFALDRLSDVTCDWWSDVCREASSGLSLGYVGVILYVGFALYNVSQERGELNAVAQGLELSKAVVKSVNRFFKPSKSSKPAKDNIVDVEDLKQ